MKTKERIHTTLGKAAARCYGIEQYAGRLVTLVKADQGNGYDVYCAGRRVGGCGAPQSMKMTRKPSPYHPHKSRRKDGKRWYQMMGIYPRT